MIFSPILFLLPAGSPHRVVGYIAPKRRQMDYETAYHWAKAQYHEAQVKRADALLQQWR